MLGLLASEVLLVEKHGISLTLVLPTLTGSYVPASISRPCLTSCTEAAYSKENTKPSSDTLSKDTALRHYRDYLRYNLGSTNTQPAGQAKAMELHCDFHRPQMREKDTESQRYTVRTQPHPQDTSVPAARPGVAQKYGGTTENTHGPVRTKGLSAGHRNSPNSAVTTCH